jgi:non-ribosomal peptide synthetase component F
MQQKIVNEFNRPGTHYPRDKTIHELLEEQVQQCPDSMALLGGEVRLTYQQLNSRANQLAHLLIDQGIVPGDRVAFCLDRSAAAIVAILAILKSGAVYVPLDASYPDERLNFILADTAAPFLISSGQFAKKFSGYSGQVFSLDHWQTTLDQWPSEIRALHPARKKSHSAAMLVSS